MASLDRAVGRIAERLLEAVHPADAAATEGLKRMFDEKLHPRTHGQFRYKGGAQATKVHGRGRKGGFSIPAPKPEHVTADVGITPFRPEDEIAGFYESPKFKRFQHDMRRFAAKNHVTIDKAQHATGIWQGETEPSLAVDAHDGEAGVDTWAAELGKKYDQDGVLLFHPDPEGDSATYSFDKLGEEGRQTFTSYMEKNGIDGGRLVDDRLELMGKGVAFHNKVEKLADDLQLNYSAKVGRMNLIEKGGYDAAIQEAKKRAEEARAELTRQHATAQAERARGPNQRVGAGKPVDGGKLARTLSRAERDAARQAPALASRQVKPSK